MDSAKGPNPCSSVYSRHYPPCPSDDINYKRRRCPKWINGVLSDGPFIQRSAKTRSWEKAEEFKRELEAEYEAKQNGDREAVAVAPEKISVKDAVARFITSKRNENLAESTLDKLKTIFEKQFLSWVIESRLKHLEEIQDSGSRSISRHLGGRTSCKEEKAGAIDWLLLLLSSSRLDLSRIPRSFRTWRTQSSGSDYCFIACLLHLDSDVQDRERIPSVATGISPARQT